jgi:hypothetical protein
MSSGRKEGRKEVPGIGKEKGARDIKLIGRSTFLLNSLLAIRITLYSIS